MMKKLLSLALLTVPWGLAAQNQPQENAEAGQGRVQYALILPEEKTPELVKVEENNPFESRREGPEKEEGNTEENQVRDILLRLPVVGGASGSSGKRIMLGGMRLVEGGDVPPVLPDQQVALKVKSISSSAIELVWVDKKPTGLPPKVLTIPLDGAAKVRYQLPSSAAAGAPAGAMGVIRRNGVAVNSSPMETRVAEPLSPVGVPVPVTSPTSEVAFVSEPEVKTTTAPPPAPLPPPADLPEASVLRMLFGNHAPGK